MAREVYCSDLGEDGTARLCTLLNYCQDVALCHSASADFTQDRLYAEKRAWILLSMNMRIFRYPSISEKLFVSTYTTGFERVYGKRCFLIEDAEHNILAQASSLWIFVNTESGHPAHVFDEIMEKYGAAGEECEDYLRREPQVPECSEAGSLTVTRQYIDTNHHVNNVNYVKIAADLLPADMKIQRVQVFYRHASYEGESIQLMSGSADGVYGVLLCDKDKKPHATVRFE